MFGFSCSMPCRLFYWETVYFNSYETRILVHIRMDFFLTPKRLNCWNVPSLNTPQLATFAHKNPAIEVVWHIEIPVDSGWSALQLPLQPCHLELAIRLPFTFFFFNALSTMFLSELIIVWEQCPRIIIYRCTHTGNTGRRRRNVLNNQAGVQRKGNNVSSQRADGFPNIPQMNIV